MLRIMRQTHVLVCVSQVCNYFIQPWDDWDIRVISEGHLDLVFHVNWK